MVPDTRTFIARHEGRRLKAYKDSRGIWTIGIGHNLKADPSLLPLLQHLINEGLNDNQVDALFDHDLATVNHHLDIYLPWWRQQPAECQLVLQDMCFEMGVGGLMEFHHFLEALKAGDRRTARAQMLASLWAKQVPTRAAEDAELVHVEEAPDPDPFVRAA